MNNLVIEGLDPNFLMIISVDILLVCMIFVSTKYILSLTFKQSVAKAIIQENNIGYAITLGSVILGMALMLSGALSHQGGADPKIHASLVIGYGVGGLILMLLTRIVFDRLSVPKFSINEEIMNGNKAAAIVDGGNIIATAMIVRAIMLWVQEERILSIAIVLGGFIISQIFLTILSVIRIVLYNNRQQQTLQEALHQGNIALAWRFTGYRLAIGLAITATSAIIPFTATNFGGLIMIWLLVSLVMVWAISMFTSVASRFMLGKRLRSKVEQDQNVSVGIIQWCLFIAIGLVFVVLSHIH